MGYIKKVVQDAAIRSGSMTGLKAADIAALRKIHGRNELKKSRSPLPQQVWEVVSEPMFVLLAIACALYFILGQHDEGFIMAAAILIVTAISIFQGVRSSKALKALQQLSAPKIKVIRDGQQQTIFSSELVPGDLMILEEGDRIPADARIIRENDFTVNESVITGESYPVDKHAEGENNLIFQGSLVNTGKCYAIVTATGHATTLGKIGKSIEAYTAPKTILQQSLNRFVRRLAFFGIAAFVVIWLINYLQNGDLLASLLIGLTLAMAAIPEEIPVAFSTFMALGAYHMSRLGIISRQPQVIENLGAVNTICLDKTGTITENRMSVRSVYDFSDGTISISEEAIPKNNKIILHAAMASEHHPFDAMEVGLWEAYHQTWTEKKDIPPIIFEYPLSGQPPMMTHVYEEGDGFLACAKGAPERIIQLCGLTEKQQQDLLSLTRTFAEKGERVIAVASAQRKGPLPEQQDQWTFTFEGLIGLYDPPRENIRKIFEDFTKAGIGIKLVTGDYPETAINIAAICGIPVNKKFVTGTDIMRMNEQELAAAADGYQVFARMFPDAKLRLIEAFKKKGAIVAMTGDGVNDGPALKAANVGIAMGKKGTETARQAADIILTNDRLETVTEAIRQGRKIYQNLKKAVRYIISIHIPIILTASLPLLFGWAYPNIFTPVHVIFLELVMGPTCSVFFENEPAEYGIMERPPREKRSSLFERGELWISIIQGLVITTAVLALYYYFMQSGRSLEATRTIVFITLMISNIFLTITNRSFTENFTTTFKYRNHLFLPMILLSLVFLASLIWLPFMRNAFGLAIISSQELITCAITGFLAVSWFELYKALKRGNKL